MIRNGVHEPRALIFKALADIFGIPCSLDRGGYNKCWNTVLLCSKDKHVSYQLLFTTAHYKHIDCLQLIVLNLKVLCA